MALLQGQLAAQGGRAQVQMAGDFGHAPVGAWVQQQHLLHARSQRITAVQQQRPAMAAQGQGQQQAFRLVCQQRGRCATCQAGHQLVPGQCRMHVERHAQAGRGRLAQLGIDEAAMARAETGDQGR
ncbi:hypothetical protein D3C81_1318230 [compost metagenome]